MTKAETTPTTPPETTQSTPEWPPIIELGRLLAATNAEHNRQDLLSLRTTDAVEKSFAERTMRILEDRNEALQMLISALPAQTIADSAVQLDVACEIAEDLYGNVHDADEVAQRAKRLLQIALSTLMVVAKEAGLDMKTMHWSAAEALFGSHFPEGGVA